jgi:hypothetical protein
MRPLSTSVAFTALIGIMLARCSVGLSAQTPPDHGTQSNSCIKAGAAAVLTDRELKDYRSLKAELEAALPNHVPTPSEDRLLRAVVTGTTAWGGDCAGEKDPSNDLAHAESWGQDRTVDAKLIRWLVVDHDAVQLVASSGIDLRAARIAGTLYLSNATVPFPIIIAHCLMGDINLSDAETRTMDFHGSSINNLSGQGVSVNGDLLINGGLTAAGSVDLTDARIDGDLRCNGAHFKKTPESIAVALAQIKRNAYFDKIDTVGKIRLNRSTINGDLDFDDARFLGTENADHQGPVQTATAAQLQAAFVTVGGTLFWQRVSLSPTTLIDLSSTNIGTLWDDGADWPPSPFLYLDGFVYRKIAAEAPMTAGTRLEWLRRQPKEFRPQPYEQLAHVFDEAGMQDDATAVRVASEQQAYESAAVGHLTSDGVRFWSFLLRWTIGYGYRPFLALIPIIFFVLLGTVLFWSGYQRGVLTPVEKDAAEYFEKTRQAGSNPQLIIPSPPAGYQPFNAFFYSLESFLPLVKLHQEDYWLPNAALKRKWGMGLRYYLWIHILAGWFFSAMLVAGVTGLVHPQ